MDNMNNNEYARQLEEIESLLADDPNNLQYLKLKNDLLNVIALTQNLAADQELKAVEKFSVGERVEIISGERPYAAVVTQVIGDTECVIKYFEFATEVVLESCHIRKILGSYFNSNQVAPGLKCQCKYGADQMWYDATVDSISEYGYNITYTQYGNKDEVPLEYLRPLGEKKDKAKVSIGNGMASSVVNIPENLKILPTDTEEEKNKKKKKIKAIKSKNRIQVKEAEISAVQNNWKSFVNKTEKKASKSLSTIATAVPKTSMFASPEETDGKVGVTRSGLGMTDFEKRKRHKFTKE